MNPFLLRPRERLNDWKAFRQSLPIRSEPEQLQAVALYWAQAPIFNRAYDVVQPQDWTSPWEMVQANRWCRKSTAIGMEVTLRLSGWAPSRMRLKLIADFDLQDTFFVLEIDGQFWLNHEYRKVIPVGGDYQELCVFAFDGRDYIEVLSPMALAA